MHFPFPLPLRSPISLLTFVLLRIDLTVAAANKIRSLSAQTSHPCPRCSFDFLLPPLPVFGNRISTFLPIQVISPSIESDPLPLEIPTVQSSGNRHLILEEHQLRPATRHLSPLSRHLVPAKKNAHTNIPRTILRNDTPQQQPLLLLHLLYHQNQPPILPIPRTTQLRHAPLPVPTKERAAMVCAS